MQFTIRNAHKHSYLYTCLNTYLHMIYTIPYLLFGDDVIPHMGLFIKCIMRILKIDHLKYKQTYFDTSHIKSQFTNGLF